MRTVSMTRIHRTRIFPYQAEMRGDKGQLLAVLDLQGRLLHMWTCGEMAEFRYRIGEFHERLFGYDPEGVSWPYKMARFIGLSGY